MIAHFARLLQTDRRPQLASAAPVAPAGPGGPRRAPADPQRVKQLGWRFRLFTRDNHAE